MIRHIVEAQDGLAPGIINIDEKSMRQIWVILG